MTRLDRHLATSLLQLKAARIAAGLTRRQLAARLGVHPVPWQSGSGERPGRSWRYGSGLGRSLGWSSMSWRDGERGSPNTASSSIQVWTYATFS